MSARCPPTTICDPRQHKSFVLVKRHVALVDAGPRVALIGLLIRWLEVRILPGARFSPALCGHPSVSRATKPGPGPSSREVRAARSQSPPPPNPEPQQHPCFRLIHDRRRSPTATPCLPTAAVKDAEGDHFVAQRPGP